MSVAVATLGCTRKSSSFPSWKTLFNLQGDYTLYFNYENKLVDEDNSDIAVRAMQTAGIEEFVNRDLQWSFDVWSWNTYFGKGWRSHPKFDQDQSRLAGIVCARNMCIEYAMQTNSEALLFIDADIIPPLDIIPKMLEVINAGEDAVCGLVNGRGAHKNCQYVFQSKGYEVIVGAQCQRVEHANIGFTMLSSRLFNQVRFRYGYSEYPDGRKHTVSDDPAYHLDAFIKFGKWPVIRMDVVGNHVGELLPEEVSQF